MADEKEPDTLAESALLEQDSAKPIPDSLDQMPIGGGNKFTMSEFPEENDKPAPKKPPARKPTKPKKEEPTDTLAETVPENTNLSSPVEGASDAPKPTTNSIDQLPIGGGNKFAMSEFPSENDQPAPKKAPVRKPVKPKKEQPKVKPLDQIPVGGNNTDNAFDEKPIGKADGAFTMSEFPEGDVVEVAPTTYTMSQKLKSKAVKMRLSGLDDLIELLTNDPNSPEILEITMASLLKETTPVNIERSLQCLKAWMKADKNWGEDEAKNAIENGFINGKPNTKKLTVEIMDEMYETKPQVIEMLILIGFKNKTPKLIAGYNSALNEILAIYGIKRMKFLKPYFPEVIRVIGAEKLAAVKTEGMNTLKEAYKWLGKEVIEPMLITLKEALKKQLDNWWESYDKDIVMSAPKDIPQETTGKSKGKKMDAYELSDAVDIFKKYNEKWTESVLKAEKWNEKTRMMEEFVKAAGIPKIANSEFRHITELIRRLINDSNFNVVLWTLKITAVMAKGLRKYFHGSAKAQFFSIIGKLREKRTQMVDQTFNTLTELNYCLGIEDVLDDVKEGLVDKAPTMRVHLLNWIGKHVEQKTQEKGGQCPDKTKDAIKKLIPLFEKLLEDGVADIRSTMVKNLAKLEMLIGDDFFSTMKGKVSTKNQSKINAKVLEKHEVIERSTKKVEPEMTRSGVSSKSNAKVNESKVNLARTTSMVVPQQKQVKQAPLEIFDQPFFDQCLQTLVKLGLPEEELKSVTASGANERSTVLSYLRQNPYENFNAVIRVIRKTFKEWKEVNLKMNKDLIAYLEQRVTDISKPEAYALIPYIAEKIGDSKFSEQLNRLVILMCERVPAKFMMGHFIRYARSPENKKPKLNGDICVVLARIIESASISNCNLKETVEYARDTYAVPFSKKGAQELLICLYSQAGDSIKPMLDENTLKNMEGEFKSIKPLNEDQKKPRIAFEGEAAVAAVQSQQTSKKQSSKQDGRPRDLSLEVQKALPLMNDSGNWQKRKDGAEILISQLQFGGKVSFGSQVGELMSTLKAHINDTNKQLIKVFVHLAGLALVSLSERQLKPNIKGFIITLVEGLSDKNEQNRIEIINTFARIGENIGRECILSNMGPYLQGCKDGRLEVLHLILIHEEGIYRSDIRDYPKGLVNCLVDKNKEIRSTAERVFEKVYEKLGMEVFKSIGKDQRPAVAKDLKAFFDRFERNDRNTYTNSSINSKGVSPSKTSERQHGQPRNTFTQPPQPPTSAKKRSLSRNNPGTKSFVEHEEDPHAVTTSGQFFIPKTNKVEGNELFANTKTLITERVERQSNEELYVWRLDQIKQFQEEAVRTDIEGLIRQDVGKRLFSFQYKRVLEGVAQLIKSSKDINHQAQLKELFDLLLKWVLMKLWGGQPALCTIVELVFSLLSILQKRKAMLSDFQVDLVLAIIREYFISASLVGPKVSQTLYSIIKCLIPLSSGQRVLRKVLKQFFFDIPNLHRHIKREVNDFYREGLCRLIKKELADHVGNEDTLEEASKIKELREDPEFVNMLFRRFHEDVLKCFGFKRIDAQGQAQMQGQGQTQMQGQGQMQAQQASGSRPSHGGLNQSGTSAQKPPHRNYAQPNSNNGSFVGQSRDKSGERLPPAGHPSTMSQDLRPSQLPGKPLDRKSNLSQHNIVKPPHHHGPPSYNQPSIPSAAPSTSSQIMNQTWNDPYDSSCLDLQNYPAPHPASPLSKHLNKLLPPNENIINFFNTLFQESGQKITNQLATNAKIIFGSILKSVQDLLAVRKDYTPERIVIQITLLQNCIKCPHIMRNIGELIGFGTEFALTQLVYEDEHKSQIYEQLRSRNIEYKADNFIKAINGVMLRILENSNSQDVVNVLLELLTYYSRGTLHSPKTISLIVKCMGRVSKDFAKDLRPEAVKLFLLRSLQYLTCIDYDVYLEQLDLSEKERNKEKIRPQDSTTNCVKAILIEICKQIGSEIWQHYEKVMAEFQGQDKWISNFISTLNVRVPERGRGRSQQNRENQQLKKINQLLSKNRSYESGIALLKKYTEKHPEFNAEEYFTSLNYDRKFIQMVIGSLDGRRSIMRASSREQEAPENIQDRIKRLKERFQEIQPEGEAEGSNNNSSMNRGNSGQDEELKEERALEIKRRIEEMKNKMNSAVRNR